VTSCQQPAVFRMVRNRLYFVRIHRIRYALMRDRSGYSVDRLYIPNFRSSGSTNTSTDLLSKAERYCKRRLKRPGGGLDGNPNGALIASLGSSKQCGGSLTKAIHVKV